MESTKHTHIKIDTGVPLLPQIKYIYFKRDTKLECWLGFSLYISIYSDNFLTFSVEKKKKERKYLRASWMKGTVRLISVRYVMYS